MELRDVLPNRWISDAEAESLLVALGRGMEEFSDADAAAVHRWAVEIRMAAALLDVVIKGVASVAVVNGEVAVALSDEFRHGQPPQALAVAGTVGLMIRAGLDFREREVIKLRRGVTNGVRYTPSEVARIFKFRLDCVEALEQSATAKLYAHASRHRVDAAAVTALLLSGG